MSFMSNLLEAVEVLFFSFQCLFLSMIPCTGVKTFNTIIFISSLIK